MLGGHAHVLRCPRRPRRRALGMLSHELGQTDGGMMETILGALGGSQEISILYAKFRRVAIACILARLSTSPHTLLTTDRPSTGWHSRLQKASRDPSQQGAEGSKDSSKRATHRYLDAGIQPPIPFAWRLPS